MRVKSELQLGKVARGDKLTDLGSTCGIYPCGEGPPGAETYARYTEVIALFTQSLNGYAANSLSRFRASALRQAFNAEGEQHRRVLRIFSARAYSRECR